MIVNHFISVLSIRLLQKNINSYNKLNDQGRNLLEQISNYFFSLDDFSEHFL